MVEPSSGEGWDSLSKGLKGADPSRGGLTSITEPRAASAQEGFGAKAEGCSDFMQNHKDASVGNTTGRRVRMKFPQPLEGKVEKPSLSLFKNQL